MMKDVKASNARERWTGWREGENYPAFVVQGRCIDKELLVVRCQCQCKEKKSDEEAKKEQRNELTESGPL
jgi:hypothetical protein